MSQTIATPVLQQKLSQLASFLEQASKLARELSGTTAVTPAFKPGIPELKRPAYVPPDEEWFWTPEWQAGEQAANEALARGSYVTFNKVEDAIAELHRHV